MTFIFQLVNIVYHNDWFADIKNSLHPEINFTWSWCMTFLMHRWSCLAGILLRILHLWSPLMPGCNFLFFWYFLMLGCNFLFSWYLCLIFGIRVMGVSQDEFRSILSFLWNSYGNYLGIVSDKCQLFFKYLVEF